MLTSPGLCFSILKPEKEKLVESDPEGKVDFGSAVFDNRIR